ncbi:MAG: tRNA (adenosine(37)-N6)-threonylcarbamoyltransferase complex dimerization subunit type 1 TsaB [Candidatus Sumerlaeaceae bacterium]|nr:tRNA (adenosine(37)-N6)-threonylcarbamoyltransferase complex dimerization subunit type 1 TsaB [Candidatus Sumerlaeaceae bacterium]
MILGLESSGRTGGVALVDEQGVRVTAMVTSRALYSQRLLPSVDWALQRVGASPKDLKGIAVSLGPGSFTGLRVGLSTAKGLALAHNLPLVGVPTLEALALRAAVAGLPNRICTVIGDRFEQLYAALYEVRPPSASSTSSYGNCPEIVALKNPQACPWQTACEWVTLPTVFAGDAAVAFRDKWKEALGERFVLAPVARAVPSAEEIAMLGARRIERGERDSLATLEPLYVQESYAQKRR